MVLALGSWGSNSRSRCLISDLNFGRIGTWERLVYQLSIADFLEVIVGGDVQIKLEEFDLVYYLVKSLYVLLSCITPKVLGLPLGSKCLLELAQLGGIGLFLLLSCCLWQGNFVLKGCLLNPLLLSLAEHLSSAFLILFSKELISSK